MRHPIDTRKYPHLICILGVLALLLLNSSSAKAQSLMGLVCDLDSNPLGDATVIVYRGDSVAALLTTDRAGKFAFNGAIEGDAVIEAQAPGYESTFVSCSVPCPPVTLKLRAQARELNELVVEGDRSHTVKRLANGQRFFLSKQAREESDPFVALAEIPGLVSNPVSMSLTMADGKAPLILIDGAPVNSGIAPISPADIESVDVINSVSARYLAQGTKTIVNIKLKKHRAPFVVYALNLSHGVPRKSSSGSTFVDIGTEKVSLTAFVSYSNTHKSQIDGNTVRKNEGYNQAYDWSQINGGNTMLGYMLLKFVPTAKDYFAFKLIADGNWSTTDRQGQGLYIDSETHDFTTCSRNKDRGTVANASAYYKHEWTDKFKMEAKAGYNNNSNRLDMLGKEEFGPVQFDTDYRYRSKRHSGNVDVDLTKETSNGQTFEAGYHAAFLSDIVRLHGVPDFRYKNTNQYVYGAFTGRAGSLYYTASAGAEGTWLNAGGSSNFYLRPRANVSLTYSFNPSHSLQLAYTCTNQSPETSKLNPNNTSTDSLVIVRGNPRLTPMNVQDLGLAYTFNKGGFYSSLKAAAYRESDLALATGYTDPSGVYVSTYANQSYYHQLYAQLDLGLSTRFCGISANFNATTYLSRNLYRNHSPRDIFVFIFNTVLRSKRITAIASIDLSPKSYTDISVTKHYGSDNTLLSLRYAVSKNLKIGVDLRGICGTYRKRTITENGTYYDNTFTRAKSSAFYPSISLNWRFTKRAERHIKLDDVLPATEKGIKLK